MAPVYADHPYALIPSPAFQDSKDEKGPVEPDMFCRVASEMAMVHNMAIRGLNSIYLQAPHVAAAEAKYFSQYMLAWHALLHVHHSGEEAHFFPAVEAMTGEAGVMEANVAQHREFHDGLDGFRAYAEACASGREGFDGGKVVGLIDGFGEVLTKHLREEIATLLGLRKFGPEKMAELESKFGEDGEKSMKELGLVKGLPFCFANHDVGYEDGRWASWPPAPNIVKLICRHVTYHLHAKCWRFAACDRMGRLRPLYAVGEEETTQES